MADKVAVEKEGAVTIVSIDRFAEARNAVDPETAVALRKAFHDFEADPDQSVAILTGRGGTFCSGFDLKVAADRAGREIHDPEGPGPMGPTRHAMYKPVIAAIEGYAVAGGLELALWCDLRVASESAKFGVFCRRWGVPLIDGGTIRLPRLIGHSRALDMILTGRPVDAAEALAMGLANRVVARGKSREAAEALAAEIARFPQATMRGDRRSSYEQEDLDVRAALAHEFALSLPNLEEARQGALRFASGRGRGGRFDEI
jgi:enoyl-CoA hydratase